MGKLLVVESPPITLSKIFKIYRKHHQITQGDLAKILGCAKSFIARIENKKSKVSLDKIVLVAMKLDLDPNFLAKTWLDDQVRDSCLDIDSILKANCIDL